MPQPFSEITRVKSAVLARDGFRCVHCGVANDRHKAAFGIRLGVWLKVPGSAFTVAGCESVCRACAARRRRGPRKLKT